MNNYGEVDGKQEPVSEAAAQPEDHASAEATTEASIPEQDPAPKAAGQRETDATASANVEESGPRTVGPDMTSKMAERNASTEDKVESEEPHKVEQQNIVQHNTKLKKEAQQDSTPEIAAHPHVDTEAQDVENTDASNNDSVIANTGNRNAINADDGYADNGGNMEIPSDVGQAQREDATNPDQARQQDTAEKHQSQQEDAIEPDHAQRDNALDSDQAQQEDATEQHQAPEDDSTEQDHLSAVDEGTMGDTADAENGIDNDDDDKDSEILPDVDETHLDNVDGQDCPVDIDEDIAKSLKATKRKRAEGDLPIKKPKEGTRPKKRVRDDDDDDDGDGSEGASPPQSSRPRRTRARTSRPQTSRKKKKAEGPETDEETLTPEQRRKRAISRAIDEAIKKPKNRRRTKKDEIELENQIDEYIAKLKVRMEEACIADNNSRDNGEPAVQKLKLLPEVMVLVSSSAAQDSITDPDINFIQSLRYFLEPLNDGSLPAYDIQLSLFEAFMPLSLSRETLLSSGIGKLVVYYTRSKRPEPNIKRMAERLLSNWSRVVLRKTDDYKKRKIETATYDYDAAKLAQRQADVLAGSQLYAAGHEGTKARLETERARFLALPNLNQRPRQNNYVGSYTIAPVSTFDPTKPRPNHRPIGAGGHERFRRLIQRRQGRKPK